MSPDRASRFMFHLTAAMNATEPFSSNALNQRAAYEMVLWISHDYGTWYDLDEERYTELAKDIIRHSDNLDPSELQAALLMFCEALQSPSVTQDAIISLITDLTPTNKVQEARYYVQKRLETRDVLATLPDLLRSVLGAFTDASEQIKDTANLQNLDESDKRTAMRRLFWKSQKGKETRRTSDEFSVSF